jgi:alkanesulfonate monooxygenase SsuD/methylene tetrahydromethanopterin reductase-like flavin-dependent oxidoreductase (luciferase family)
MKYGFVLPSGDAKTAARLAYEAEQAGWDGFFVWEPVWGIDAWVCLTAAAMRTSTIRLGTMLTPISRMRPWKLASETATLDNLSDGRVILAVGLGAVDSGFIPFGEVTDKKVRAELMDEGLDILTGLWKGQPFAYEGKHYHVQPTDFAVPPPPVQQPHIPIWMVGGYPSEKSMARAMKYDGLIPNILKKQNGKLAAAHDLKPAHVREMMAYVNQHRTAPTPYDVIAEGATPANDPARAKTIVQEWENAGATWWLEALWNASGADEIEARVRQGPPR